MIEELLPVSVSVAESFGDPDVPPPLFPAEAELVAGAVDKRRREFATVRACAREAMGRLGAASVPLLRGTRGEPLWPAGLVGSMTHCDGYRAAAVARATDFVTVGMDAEPNQPIDDDGVLRLVTRAEERPRLLALAARYPEVHWDRLVFSAKESTYKAWFPLTGRWLDFEEAVITLDPEAGTFTARLLVPGPAVIGVALPGFSGRWLVRNGLLVTAIAVPVPASNQQPPAAR
ncbi:4'-phosphopantetheinyl transferase superfamily protein [Streptomyces sp. A3M-1-3]|uniref:4'-phosphopantetheinyl transferase family protein n=1 Tax=Streptomyces sp. A3M-1-3 TaxID=2962044 RepID=UPI0020B85ACD|nr:4'-phosphopantetheinyl transferase superfamily protein [Streptomyces sp. A3M-1-3]MCP3822750.1 4'-phosphopantetheinyl transferase superfamily protein [Streptomyces sp. A3M-1-3]